MAATPVDVLIGVGGVTGLTLRLYPLGSDTLANAPADSLAEQVNRAGTYRALVDEALSGIYEAYVLDTDGDVFFYGFLYLEDTTDVWTVADDLASARARVGAGGIQASSFAAESITAAALASDAVTEIQSGIGLPVEVTNNITAIKNKTDYLPSVTAGQAGGLFVAGSNAATTVNITGNLSGSVGSVTGRVTANIADNDSDAVIAGAVWDAWMFNHQVGGSFGDAMQAPVVFDDPWSRSLPGAYTADQAGYLLGAYLNAPVATIDTVVDAIKAKTDYLPSATAGQAGGVFIAGANAATSIAGLTTSITGNLSGSVGAIANGGITSTSFASSAIDANALSADAVAELVAGINGQGARTVAITIDNSTDPLEGARVRLTKGAETYLQTTNVNGQCTFNVNDGTWLVAITLFGYEFSGALLLVDADQHVAYSLTPYMIALPAAPSLTTGYVLCLGTDGLPEAGVKIYAQLTAGPGDDGYALATDTITMTSDEDGLAQHAGFVRGASYKFRRGDSTWWTAAAVAPSTATWNLREILGAP